MLKKILSFNEPEFYQDHARLIHNAVDRYAKAVQDETISADERLRIQQDSESVLRSVMVETGYRTEADAFISIDREFMHEGRLNDEKVQKFQKQMLLQYADQQVKWTFAGIIRSWSPALRNPRENQAAAYEDLLPQEMKSERSRQRRSAYSANTGADFQIYMYADGTISNQFLPEKGTIAFDRTISDSGRDWQTGYKPETIRRKTARKASFNHDEVWECDAGDPTTEPSIDSGISENAIGLICIPGTDMVYVVDPDLVLLTERQDELYSPDGELYDVREVDHQASVAAVKDYLARNTVKHIGGFILGKLDPDIIKQYREQFTDSVSESTGFFSKNDPRMKSHLDERFSSAETSKINAMVLNRFNRLFSNGRRGDELYNGLLPASVQNEYAVHLDIFNSREDYDAFVALPTIREITDEETRRWLGETAVPAGKKKALSNAVQNILHNYKQIFPHAAMTPAEVLQAAYAVLAEGGRKGASIKKKIITTEKNFYEFIKASGSTDAVPAVPRLKRAAGRETEYANLFDEAAFRAWAGESDDQAPIEPAPEGPPTDDALKDIIVRTGLLTDEKKEQYLRQLENAGQETGRGHWTGVLAAQGISADVAEQIWQRISARSIPESKKELFSIAVQNVFAAYGAIRVSTGKTPLEVLTAIEDIIISDSPGDHYKKIRIFFDTPLDALIHEAAQETPPAVTMIKDDIGVEEISSAYVNEPDLLKDDDLATFAVSPLFTESGIDASEQEAIIAYIRSARIPMERAAEFSRGVIQVVKAFRQGAAPAGITALLAVHSVTEIARGTLDCAQSPVRDIVKSVMRQSMQRKEVQDAVDVPVVDQNALAQMEILNSLDFRNNDDINTFVQSSFFHSSEFSEKETAEIIKLLKKTVIPKAKMQDFTMGFFKTFSAFRQHLAPLNIQPTNAFRALTHIINGNEEKVPERLRTILKKIVLSVPNNAGTPPSTDSSTLSAFVAGPEFRDSGLTVDQLQRILDHYHENVHASRNGSYRKVPLVFRSSTGERGRDAAIAVNLALHRRSGSPALHDVVSGVAWVVSRNNQNTVMLHQTDLGRRLMDNRQTGHLGESFHQPGSVQPGVSGAMHGDGESIAILEPRAGVHHSPVAFTYGIPAIRPRMAADSPSVHQNGFADSEISRSLPVSQMPAGREIRDIPDHIQRHYMQDSMSLAKERQAGSFSRETGQPGPESKQKIKRSLDDLYNEFMKRIEKNG